MPRLRPAPKEEKEVEKVAATAEPEIAVEEEPEVEVEVTESEVPKQDDATIALKKQIEDLKRSEQVLRERNEQFAREREEALERARNREAQIAKVQKEAYDSQTDAISSAIAAAQAELDKAELDIENAISIGDAKGQAAAIKRQTIAASNLGRLEEGKAAAEERAKAPPVAEVDPIDTWGLPSITTTWLKNNRQWLTDPEKFEDLKGYQWQAKKAGIAPHTKEFLAFIEDRMNGVPEPEAEVEEPVKQKAPKVSAPVSRDVPNSNGRRSTPGKVTLTAQEVEAAKISGISPEEYAKQKIRKQQMVDSGEYGEQR